MSDTTQSTLVNKTSNATTADTINSEIDPLPILLPLIGILGIAVIIAILAWKNKWRRKRFFGRKGCTFCCFFSSKPVLIDNILKVNMFSKFKKIRSKKCFSINIK